MIVARLLACAHPTEESDLPPEVPLHEVWGIAPADDDDPDPAVVDVTLEANDFNVDWVDAARTRVWGYNFQTPGPLIHAKLGDTVRVHFTNLLPGDPETTIHWHGLRISDQMDGVPAIVAPVQPGGTFDYEFVPPDPGTYWYHPHVHANEQIERGLQGVIVIDEAEPPNIDRDRYFVLDDVLLADSGAIVGGFDDMEGMTAMMGRFGNTLLVNGQTGVLEDTIRPGSIERWRVLNTANAREMWIDVQGARWRVVGTDGGLIYPYTTAQQLVAIGQRFDLEVIPDADATTVTLEILQPGQQSGWDHYPVFTGTIAGDPVPHHDVHWNSPPLPEIREATQEVQIVLDTGRTMAWSINGVSYDMSDPNVDPIDVAGNTPTVVTIEELSGMDHPFHLHGQFAQVLDRDGDPADEPGLKDTVLIGGGTTVRLYSDFENPGRWMAHCHILEHAEAGMMTEVDVSP